MLDQNQLISSPLFVAIFQSGGSPFSPTDIAGLQLWLKADTGTFQDSAKTTPAVSDGDVVGAWEDQSGSGNDVLQTTTANKPLLKLNIANNRPVIRFDGTNDDLVVDSFAAELSQPNTIFAAIEVRNVEDDQFWVFDGVVAGKQNELKAQTATIPDFWRMIAGVNLTGGNITRNEIILMDAKYNGASSELKQNGSIRVSGDAGLETLDGFKVGARRSNVNHLDGDFAEILIYNTDLAATERQKVEQYFASRYGITLV